MATIEQEAVKVPAIQPALRLDGIDYVELYVGNAYQAAHFYRTTLGLRMTAYTVSLAVETTYFAGKSHSGEDAPTRDQYGDFRLASAFSGAVVWRRSGATDEARRSVSYP